MTVINLMRYVKRGLQFIRDRVIKSPIFLPFPLLVEPGSNFTLYLKDKKQNYLISLELVQMYLMNLKRI